MGGPSQFAKQGFGKHTPWMDLVNSLEHNGLGRTTEHLADLRWREDFFRRWGFAIPGAATPAASLRQLRELLHRCAEQIASGGTLEASELRALNAAMSVPVRREVFQHQNGFEIREVPKRADWKCIRTQIAASFARMLVDGSIQRVKFCQDERCRWIFMDATKGRTRVWCNERTCGNRNRVRRARAANANMRAE